jgi:hypothetical protein
MLENALRTYRKAVLPQPSRLPHKKHCTSSTTIIIRGDDQMHDQIHHEVHHEIHQLEIHVVRQIPEQEIVHAPPAS